MYVYIVGLKLRRVRVTVVAVQKQEVLNIRSVCPYFCLSYPALKAHAPYSHLWPYHILPHYLLNGTVFGKKLLNTGYSGILGPRYGACFMAFFWRLQFGGDP
jgi:hypothetical protein